MLSEKAPEKRPSSGDFSAFVGRRAPLPDVSVVLPCLNEVRSVGSCVSEALDAAHRARLSCEVIVVDNGSTDGSREAALRAGARVVDEPTRGYGSALRAGIEAARAPVVVMADADCTYPLNKLEELIGPVVSGEADLVLGARLDEATRASMPFLHRFVGTPTLSFLIRRAGKGIRISDSQSGFRAFHRDRIQELGLQATGMEFASEMLIRAAGAGLRITEVQTGYRERIGESKLETLSDGWRHLQLILCLAPQLLLIGPGVAAMALGLVSWLLALANPSGLMIGSFRWQPMFFSTIFMVIGTLGVLSGLTVAHSSVLTPTSAGRRYAFFGSERLPALCTRAGAGILGAGLALDLALFFVWISRDTPVARGFAMAAFAQTLIIDGAVLVVFGVVSRLQRQRIAYEWVVASARRTGREQPDVRWAPRWADKRGFDRVPQNTAERVA